MIAYINHIYFILIDLETGREDEFTGSLARTTPNGHESIVWIQLFSKKGRCTEHCEKQKSNKNRTEQRDGDFLHKAPYFRKINGTSYIE